MGMGMYKRAVLIRLRGFDNNEKKKEEMMLGRKWFEDAGGNWRKVDGYDKYTLYMYIEL